MPEIYYFNFKFHNFRLDNRLLQNLVLIVLVYSTVCQLFKTILITSTITVQM